MQSIDEIENQVLTDQRTYPVISWLNNSLFNALALYYLVNNFKLPETLFDEYPLDSEFIKSLKSSFPSEETLDLFFKCFQPEPIEFQNHLVEKVITLGVFWRSLYVEQLRISPHLTDPFFKSAETGAVTFMRLISDFRKIAKGSDIERKGLKESTFYQFCADFFDNLSLDEAENEEMEFFNYWDLRGRTAYLEVLLCDSPIELSLFSSFVDNFLEIPFNLFITDKEKYFGRSPDMDEQIPPLELSISTDNSSCLLIQTEENELLEEYDLQIRFYAEEEREIEKGSIAALETYPFVRLDLFPSTLEDLCIELEEMENCSSFEESFSDSENSFKQQKFNEELANLKANLRLLKAKEFHYKETLLKISKSTNLSPEELDKFKEYQDAADAAKRLHKALRGSLKRFEGSERTEENYNEFRKASLAAIDIHKPILEHHRDFDKIIANIIGAILGLIVIYAAVLAINYVANGFHNTMWHSEGGKVVDLIEGNIGNFDGICRHNSN